MRPDIFSSRRAVERRVLSIYVASILRWDRRTLLRKRIKKPQVGCLRMLELMSRNALNVYLRKWWDWFSSFEREFGDTFVLCNGVLLDLSGIPCALVPLISRTSFCLSLECQGNIWSIFAFQVEILFSTCTFEKEIFLRSERISCLQIAYLSTVVKLCACYILDKWKKMVGPSVRSISSTADN